MALGKKFDRPDLERVGLFMEMPYVSGRYYPRKGKIPHEAGNMLCGDRKMKDGTQYGYFEKEYKRIYSKEAISWRKTTEKPKYKNITNLLFMPAGGHKLHSSPGDYYGTFSGVIEAFSNKKKPQPPPPKEMINFYSGPLKIGGPGYANICINPYPEHKSDRWIRKAKGPSVTRLAGPMVTSHYPEAYFEINPFKDPEKMKPGRTYIQPKEKLYRSIPPGFFLPNGPPKTQGGCHDGCFNKFPVHMTDRQKIKPKHYPTNVFMPMPMTQKSFYTKSVVNTNVDFRMNLDNYTTFQPNYTKYLVE